MKIFSRFRKQNTSSNTKQAQPAPLPPAQNPTTPTRKNATQAYFGHQQQQQQMPTTPQSSSSSLATLKRVFSPTPKKKTIATTPNSKTQAATNLGNFQDDVAQKYISNTRISMTPFQIAHGTNKENLNSSPSNKGYDFCFDQSSVMLTSKNPFLTSPGNCLSPNAKMIQSPLKSPTPQKLPAFASTPKSTGGKKRLTCASPLAADMSSKMSQSAPSQRVLSPSQSFTQNSRQYAVFQSPPQKKLNFEEMVISPMKSEGKLPITGKKRTRADCQSMDFESIGSPSAPPTEYVLSPDVFAPKNTVTRQYCLQLCLLEGRNLSNTGLGFKTCSDPYATLQLDEIQRHASEVKKQSLSPTWNEHFAFTVMIEEEKSRQRGSNNYDNKRMRFDNNLATMNKQAQTLKISVFDHDVLFDHELIGNCVVELDELVHECDMNGGKSGSVDVWKKLTKNNSDDVCGYIHLTLHLEAVGNNIFNL